MGQCSVTTHGRRGGRSWWPRPFLGCRNEEGSNQAWSRSEWCLREAVQQEGRKGRSLENHSLNLCWKRKCEKQGAWESTQSSLEGWGWVVVDCPTTPELSDESGKEKKGRKESSEVGPLEVIMPGGPCGLNFSRQRSSALSRDR